MIVIGIDSLETKQWLYDSQVAELVRHYNNGCNRMIVRTDELWS